MADLDKYDGKKATITIDHGGTRRIITGKLRSFETEARYDPRTGVLVEEPETRWELTSASEDRGHHLNARGEKAYSEQLVQKTYEAIGIDPDTVVEVSTGTRL